MFGLSLKEKTESVIENEFHYVVSDMQRQNFRMLVSEGKSLGQNEYSIAIMYMLGMMNMLAAPFEVEGEIIDPKDGRNEDEKEQFENFISLHVRTISEIKHLANSPESEIQELVDQVLINSNLLETSDEPTPSVEQDSEEEISPLDEEISSIEVEDIKSSDESIEDESEIEPLMIGTDAFLASMQVANALIQSSPGAKYLSPYQLKIVYGLQLLGGIDCISQEANTSMASCMAVMQVKLASEEIFGFDDEQAVDAFEKILDVQEQVWAQKIIISGGKAVIKIFSEDNEDMLPTMDIFDDEELMKEVAKKL